MLCAALPVATGRVSSPYGWRWLNGRSDLHTGVDIGAPEGTAVFAMLPGTVRVAAPSGELSGYGNVVVLEHGRKAFSLYAHLSRIDVLEGQAVEAGTQLGAVGRTAGTRTEPTRMFESSGAHLHVEFLNAWPPAGKDKNRLDPGPILAGLGVIIPPQGQPVRAACGPASSSAAFVAPSSQEHATSPSRSLAGKSGAAALLLLALLLWSVKNETPR